MKSHEGTSYGIIKVPCEFHENRANIGVNVKMIIFTPIFAPN